MYSREQSNLEQAEMVYGMTEQQYLDIQDNADYPDEQPQFDPMIGDDMNDSGEVD